MRKPLSIKRLDRLAPVTGEQVANPSGDTQGFAHRIFERVWSSLCDAVEALWAEAVRTGDDAVLHTLTLAPQTGDVLTDNALVVLNSTAPTGPPAARINNQGDSFFRDTTADRALFVLVEVSDFYRVGADQVVGARQAAIADAVAGTEVATINAILARLRTHGLIAT